MGHEVILQDLDSPINSYRVSAFGTFFGTHAPEVSALVRD